MLGAPKLWTAMTRHWCRLPAAASWVWWRAVCLAEGPAVTQWRAQFLAFDAQVQTASGDVVEAFFRETATPKTLIALIEALEHEKLLVRYDARRLEEQILRHIDKHGVWKHQQGRRQPA